jgi:hypothetical protein
VSQETNIATKRSLFAKSVVLVILLIGAGASLTIYALDNVFGATTNSTSTTTTSTGTTTTPWSEDGHRGWHHFSGGSFLGFKSISTVNNVTVTGFQIDDTSHISVSLAYSGAGGSPAIIIVGAGPGLTGSTTLSAGWGASKTVSLHLIGQGTLSANNFVQVAIVPLTGA